MIRQVLVKLLRKPRVILDREGQSPYLSRYYLLGSRFDSTGKRVSRSWLPFSLYLHEFHRSDDDGALHSHPWQWSVSLILKGGYTEERRVGNQVIRRLLRPGSLNLIKHDDYHRVDLLRSNAWSLFLAGPKLGTWYFWDRDTNLIAHWKSFCNSKSGRAATPIEWREET